MIEPFSFQDGLAEGMRTRTICGVSRGDSPLRLIWLKDGETLMPSLGANVSSLDQYTSILSISSLSHSHSGEYTCVASNQASEVKYSASLQVKGNVGLNLVERTKKKCFSIVCCYHNPQYKARRFSISSKINVLINRMHKPLLPLPMSLYVERSGFATMITY